MIQINNLAFSYPKAQVLNNINMTLEKGRIYGLLGENGVGKTTLLTQRPQKTSVGQHRR